MSKVLFVNHKEEQCGVQQFGKRVAQLAMKSKKHDVTYLETEGVANFNTAYYSIKPDILIVNWYSCTMGWFTPQHLDSLTCQKFCIYHDSGNLLRGIEKFMFFGDDDTVKNAYMPHLEIPISEENRVLLPRPLFNFTDHTSKNNDIPVVGSFGFGFGHKGFEDIVTLVGKSFDKAILNLHITNAYYGDADAESANNVIKTCKELKSDNVELNITTDFISDQEMLKFLSGNDINVFLYKSTHPGISSVIDYALSVRKPIGVSPCTMFRHVVSEDILVKIEELGWNYGSSLKEILDRGVEPLKRFYDEWSNDNFIKEFDKLWD